MELVSSTWRRWREGGREGKERDGGERDPEEEERDGERGMGREEEERIDVREGEEEGGEGCERGKGGGRTGRKEEEMSVQRLFSSYCYSIGGWGGGHTTAVVCPSPLGCQVLHRHRSGQGICYYCQTQEAGEHGHSAPDHLSNKHKKP
jgi:hypothetical protein